MSSIQSATGAGTPQQRWLTVRLAWKPAMASVSEEAARSLTAQRRSRNDDSRELTGALGTGALNVSPGRWTATGCTGWMTKRTVGEKRMQCSASKEVFSWCFHVCLPDCILGQGRHWWCVGRERVKSLCRLFSVNDGNTKPEWR